MAAPSVTNTFANSTTADATQVNQNFTDLINGASDGTKDYTISALTCNGNVTLNGSTTTIGNSGSDSIVFTARVGSDFDPSAGNTYQLGDSTLTWIALYLDNDTTDGGAVYFDASSTKFIKSSADGARLDLDGFTSYVLDGNIIGGALYHGWTSNLGITYSSSTLSVSGATAALSSTNPGYVCLQSKATPGRLQVYKITADQGFVDDGGSSEITGNLFGATTGIAWASDVPFFIYAVANDSENAIAFMISRDPRASVSPAAANIGAPDDPVADAESDFFSFDSLDETVYDANPCCAIGAVRMQMSSSDDWTVQTLSNKDGIGKFHESTKFTFPKGHYGASNTNTHLKDNSGSAPDFTTEDYYYYIRRDGSVRIEVYYNGDAGSDGSGSVTTLLSVPYLLDTSVQVFGEIASTLASAWGGGGRFHHIQVSANNSLSFVDESGNPMQNVDFGNGSRYLRFHLTYQGGSFKD